MQGVRVGCSMVSVDNCGDSNDQSIARCTTFLRDHGQSKVKVHCKMTNAWATIIYGYL